MPMHGGHLWRIHPAVRTGGQLKFRERAADALKMIFGTWTLLGLIIAGIIIWLRFMHDPGELHLNLGLSFLASVQGVILQIAANRGDRISAEVALHTQGNTDTLMALNERQIEMLGQLGSLNGQVSDLAEVVQAVMAARNAGPAAKRAPAAPKTLATPQQKAKGTR